MLDRPDLVRGSNFLGHPLAPQLDMRFYREDGHFDCNDAWAEGNVLLTQEDQGQTEEYRENWKDDPYLPFLKLILISYLIYISETSCVHMRESLPSGKRICFARVSGKWEELRSG